MNYASLLIAVVALPATADFTLVNEAVSQGKTKEVTLSAKGSKAYFELKEEGTPSKALLRDVSAQKLYIIDHAAKTVMVITDQDSQQMVAMQEQFRTQLRAQLAKMPPEQRARIEATMLGQAGPESKAPKFTFERKKTAPRKVGKFTCEDYVIKREGTVTGEGCFANWKSAGISAQEFKAAMQSALPGSPQGNGNSNLVAQAFEAHAAAPGFPVWRTHVDAEGHVISETTLKSFTKTALPAEEFEVPSGYAEKSMGASMKSMRKP